MNETLYLLSFKIYKPSTLFLIRLKIIIPK